MPDYKGEGDIGNFSDFALSNKLRGVSVKRCFLSNMLKKC